MRLHTGSATKPRNKWRPWVYEPPRRTVVSEMTIRGGVLVFKSRRSLGGWPAFFNPHDAEGAPSFALFAKGGFDTVSKLVILSGVGAHATRGPQRARFSRGGVRGVVEESRRCLL